MIIITRVNSVEQNVYQRPIWYAVLYKTTCLIVITIISITTGEINEISKPVDGGGFDTTTKDHPTTAFGTNYLR